MSEAGLLTVVGMILSVAMAFCGGVYAYIQSLKEREAKREADAEAAQSRRISALEERDSDLRKWLRRQGIQTAANEEPSPPAVKLNRGGA